MKAILKINGKEIEVEVSEEQIEKLTEKKENPFKRVSGGKYCVINAIGGIEWDEEGFDDYDQKFYSIANYCTDYNLIQQQAWRETLNRLLWRWQYENDDPVDWDSLNKNKYFIVFDNEEHNFTFDLCDIFNNGGVYFSTEEKAEKAIEDVVNPFMQEHPDFVW